MIKRLYQSQGIQGVLTIGYLYMVILGILGEALYYSQLGINILNYSNITDVLLSPISKITSNFYLLGVIILIVVTALSTLNSANTPEKKAKLKKWLRIRPGNESKTLDLLVVFLSIFLFSFYVGLDMGLGAKRAESIEKKELRFNDKLVFSSADSVSAKIVGVNSAYLFYVTADSPSVKISPISNLQYFERQPAKPNFSKIFK
ncbi:MAG: hypothetical protein KF870_05630 [Leadbetterella sp.]|nr:hypothetical protein [Leadbetterella sp.]